MTARTTFRKAVSAWKERHVVDRSLLIASTLFVVISCFLFVNACKYLRWWKYWGEGMSPDFVLSLASLVLPVVALIIFRVSINEFLRGESNGRQGDI